MRSKLAVLAAALLIFHPLAAQYRTAVPGYRFEFPRDYFDHPDFQTEWWYYTGNLKSASGHRYGFELTFFRQAVSRDPAHAAIWDVKDLYLAHLALSDLDGQHFYYAERINRAGPGIAGVSASSARIWNGNWQIQWKSSDQKLEAVDREFQLHLTLQPEKPPVIHGENGVSQKSGRSGPCVLLHFPDSATRERNTRAEWRKPRCGMGSPGWTTNFSPINSIPNQAGWDWLSLQLE